MELTEEQKRKLAFMLHKFQNGNVADDIYIGYEEIADFIEQLLSEAVKEAEERAVENFVISLNKALEHLEFDDGEMYKYQSVYNLVDEVEKEQLSQLRKERAEQLNNLTEEINV